jgi:hypothetical protein
LERDETRDGKGRVLFTLLGSDDRGFDDFHVIEHLAKLPLFLRIIHRQIVVNQAAQIGAIGGLSVPMRLALESALIEKASVTTPLGTVCAGGFHVRSEIF